MITLDCFNEYIRKYNSLAHLKRCVERVNNNEGYLALAGSHVVFKNYPSERVQKRIDKMLEKYMA